MKVIGMTQEHFKELFTPKQQAMAEAKIIGKKRIIKANLVSSMPITVAQESMKVTGQAHLELQKKGDVIEIIKVRCCCGRETQIVLEYTPKQTGTDVTTTDSQIALPETGDAPQ